MKTFFFVCLLTLFFGACSFPSNSKNELEEITRDVFKSHQGIEIDVKPLDKKTQALHSNASQNRCFVLPTMPD